MAKFTPLGPFQIQNLSLMAKAYVAHKGCKFASLSRYAHGDPSFFDKIVKGTGGCSVRKYDAVMTWLEDNWPKGLPWPDGVWLPPTPKKRR